MKSVFNRDEAGKIPSQQNQNAKDHWPDTAQGKEAKATTQQRQENQPDLDTTIEAPPEDQKKDPEAGLQTERH